MMDEQGTASTAPETPEDVAVEGAGREPRDARGGDTARESAPAYDTLLRAGGDPEADAAQAARDMALLRGKVEADQKRQWDGMVKEWKKQAQADPELGGAHLPTNVARAQLTLNRFDPDHRISTWLGTSGYGNHPDVLRFLTRIADALAEDTVVQGRTPGKKLSLEERMYGDWKP